MKTSGKSDPIAELRHEIRNNLTLISSRLQLLIAKYPILQTDDICLQLFEDIREAHAILNNSKTAGTSPNLLPCDMHELIQELYHTCQPLFQTNGKTLMLDMPDTLPMIRADKQQIKQALLNLIKNAAEATKKGQWCRIKAAANPEHLVITITDNGIGMTPEQKSHIFEAYVSYKQGGTGLGLHMVKSTVYAHHGQLDCQSAPKQGSSFRIALPLPSAPVQKSSQ